MATQILLPLIASVMFLVGIWLAFVEIHNWWKRKRARHKNTFAYRHVFNIDLQHQALTNRGKSR
jgi:hypothetical protein